jgi:iron complex transport system substrate-binding protein
VSAWQADDNKVQPHRVGKTVQENLMRKWWWLFLIVLCWAGLGVVVFNVEADNSNDVTITEGSDRIVSMAPNLTEILFALGLSDRIVGVSSGSDYPPEAAQKKTIGNFWQPDIETIIAARPELVVTLGFSQQRNLAERLKRIGYGTLTVDIDTVDELFSAIEEIGQVTGAENAASELTTGMREKIDGLSALMAGREKVRVLYVVQREPLRVAGRDTFVNEMIELAGGDNAIGLTVQKYPPIGTEQVISCNVDVIIEPAMIGSDLAGQRSSAAEFYGRFANVPAVVNDRVYVIEADTVARLAPRLYEGIETIARCLRPELFEK